MIETILFVAIAVVGVGYAAAMFVEARRDERAAGTPAQQVVARGQAQQEALIGFGSLALAAVGATVLERQFEVWRDFDYVDWWISDSGDWRGLVFAWGLIVANAVVTVTSYIRHRIRNQIRGMA